jgi:uncharacterized protein (DUF58 family)
VERQQREARLRWYFVLAGILVLVSIFSGGLFLYAVVVLTVLYLAALALSALALDEVRVWRQLATTEVELGVPVDARVVIQNRKSWPAPWLLWHDPVEEGIDVEGARGGFRTLEAEEKVRLSFRLHPYKRGLFRIGPTVLESSDPFGVVRRYRVDDQASFLTVLPRIVSMGAGWPLGHAPIHQVPRRRSLFEDPSRFLGIRQYRQGDSLRRIHWRASARAGSLQVKLFEPSVLEGTLLALELSAGAYPGSGKDGQGSADSTFDNTLAEVDPVEELAITAAASIGAFVLAGGQSVGLLANGADAAERYPLDWGGGSFRRMEDLLAETGNRRRPAALRPLELEAAGGERQHHRLRTLLARAIPARGPGLPRLLSAELPRLPRHLVTMIITPRMDGPLAACVGALRRSGIEVGIVWVRAPAPSPGQVSTGMPAEVPAEVTAALPISVPISVPIYAVTSPADLEAMGNRRL